MDWVLELDAAGTILHCRSGGACPLAGSDEALVGASLLDRIHPDEKARLQRLLAEDTAEAPQRLRLRHDRGDFRQPRAHEARNRGRPAAHRRPRRDG